VRLPWVRAHAFTPTKRIRRAIYSRRGGAGLRAVLALGRVVVVVFVFVGLVLGDFSRRVGQRLQVLLDVFSGHDALADVPLEGTPVPDLRVVLGIIHGRM